MAKIKILFPRLDCSFKKGPVPSVVGPPNHPIRQHWVNFIAQIATIHMNIGDEVSVDQRPLWQFQPQDIEDNIDVVYIPHHDKHSFPVTNAQPVYYMQMVFPHIFSIDFEGWCATASYTPIQPTRWEPKIPQGVLELKQRCLSGMTKFEQINKANGHQVECGYNFMPLQLPHDVTILTHSDVGMGEALKNVCTRTSELGERLVVKGHPINLQSMEPLKRIAEGYNHVTYVEEGSIHDWLAGSKRVFVVNSGVGLEAILWNKPLYTYGRSEYTSVTNAMPESLIGPESDKRHVDKYPKFLDSWYHTMYDTAAHAIQRTSRISRLFGGKVNRS